MDQVNLGFNVYTDKADAAIAASAKKGRDLFEKRGFNLNLKSGDLPLGRITGDFDKFSGSLDAATARVLAFTATTTVVYGLATAFTRLFTDSIKLEKQLAGIQAILQTSNANLQKFSSELFNVANATGQSFDVAAQAASEFARQGLSLEETLKATNSALVFSKIAGVDAATAVENLTASINTFSNEALAYTDVVDTIVSLDNAFAISAGGIADGLKRVGSVASESGIQLKEIASLISVVQQVSARGAPVISNGLKTIFTRLSRTSVQDALNSIGVATQNSNGEFRSQIEVLTDLANRLDSLSDSQRAFVLEQVAGVYQINTLQATLKSLRGEYSLFDKAVKVASDSSGNAADRLKILTDTTDANLQKLKNNVTQFLAEVGKTTVKPLLDNFVGIGNTILETLNLGAAGEAGEKAGNSIGKFLLSGISSVLSGPGTVLLIVGITKLLTKVTKDAFIAVQTLAGLRKTSLVDEKVQSSINKAIETGNQALVKRLATTTSIVEKARILQVLMADMARNQGIAQVNQAVSAGLAANKKTTASRTRGKADGFIPTYARGFIPKGIERMEKRGAMAGGYSPKRVVAAPASIGGVMNEAESTVLAEGMKQPFINPPKNSKAGRKHRKNAIRKTGIDPYTLTSQGFIPNFAPPKGFKVLSAQSISKMAAKANIAANKPLIGPEKQGYSEIKIGSAPGEKSKREFASRQNSNVEPDDILRITNLVTEKVPVSQKTKNLKGQETKGSSFLDRGTSFENDSIKHFKFRKNNKITFKPGGMFGGRTSAVDGYRIPSFPPQTVDLLEVKSGSFSRDAVDRKFKRFVSENINKIPALGKLYKENKKNDTDTININPYLAIPENKNYSKGFIPNFASRYTEARKQKRDELRASLFNVVDFAGAAIKNVNAQTEFNQARNKNPNIEWDDKINQVGFKVERIPIPDREFEDALRSKTENKKVTTKFENYSIDYLNKKGYSFQAGRNTLYGKENASVDGYNIKQNFIELLEVKGGGWDAPDVSNKFGRFLPENLVDLAPQLVSKFFKEGDPDPNINDKIRIRNVLAIPALVGGVFKRNINPQYPSADLKEMEKQRQKKTGKKIPAKFAWMQGLIDQAAKTNSSGFIPNFASRLSYNETQKAKKASRDKEAKAGIPLSKIKMGKNPSLRTPFNPEGFGIYNKYEGTLANGMSLAKKEGIDPRTKGMFASEGFIPNFAESPYIKSFFQNASPQQIARWNELYINNIEARRSAGKMGVKGGMETKNSEKRNEKAAGTSAVRQIYKEEGIKRRKKREPQPQNINPESRISIPKPESRLSITTPVNPGASTRTEGVNLDNLNQAKGRVVEPENRTSRQTAPTTLPSGPAIPMSGPTGEDPKEKAKAAKEARANARMAAAGGLAFGIPALTGMLSTPEAGKEQTSIQKNIQAGGEAVGAGLTAALTTAMIPGLAPLAPAIGIAVGGFQLLTAASKNAVPSIKGITDQNQKLIASNEKQLTSLSSAIQKTEEISQLRSSGADPRRIAKAELELSKSLIGIGDKELVNTLRNEKNDTKKQEAILSFQEKKVKEKNLSESVTAAAALAQQSQMERATGVKGIAATGLDLAGQFGEFLGFKGAAEFTKPVAELVRGPKQDFKTDQWDQFINPIIDSLDLNKLTSDEAVKGLKRLAGGTQDLGSFIKQFGEEAGMSKSQIQQITQSFNTLSGSFSADSISSLNQYTAGVIKFNQQLASNVTAKNTPVVNVNFQKVFDKALQDLTLDTALTNYKQFSDKGANLTVEKNQFALDQQAGKFSQTQAIRKQSEIQGREEALGFNQKGTEILTSAVDKLIAIIPQDLSNDQRSAIVQESKNVLTRGGDLTKLQDLIRDSVANTGKSNEILQEIAKINEETTQSVEQLKVDRAAATKIRTATEQANVQAVQDAAASQRGADIISGAASQEPKRKLLDVKLLAENNAKIEKLTAQAKIAGGSATERGRSLLTQANTLEVQNARMREEDLAAQAAAFGAPNVTGQAEAEAARKTLGNKDFAKNLATETGTLLEQLNASKVQKGQRQVFTKKDIQSITQGIEIGGEGAVQARALIESKLGDTSSESQVNKDIIERIKTVGGEKSIFNTKTPPQEEPRPAWEAATQRLVQESLTGRMGSDEVLRRNTVENQDKALKKAEEDRQASVKAQQDLETFDATQLEQQKIAESQRSVNAPKIAALESSLEGVGRTTWDEKSLLGKASTVAGYVMSPIDAAARLTRQQGSLSLSKGADSISETIIKEGLQENSNLDKNGNETNLKYAAYTPEQKQRKKELEDRRTLLRKGQGAIEGTGDLFGDYGAGSRAQSPEAEKTAYELSAFLQKVKEGQVTKEDMKLLEDSVKDASRSAEDIADRSKFIAGVKELNIPLLEESSTDTEVKRKELEKKAKEQSDKAAQSAALAEVAKKNVENFAGDPSQTLKFLNNPEEKAAALKKFQDSKDPNLRNLGEKISSLDLKKAELKKITDQEELATLTESKNPLTEIQQKRKQELESAGVKAEKLSPEQIKKKEELQTGIARDTNSIIAEGKRSYGAVNSTLYKDQVAPGILDLVQKQEDKAKIEAYNAKVLERQKKEEALSTANQEVSSIESQAAQRAKVSSAFMADTGSKMSVDEKFAITSRFNRGEITAEEADKLSGGGLRTAYKSVTNRDEGFENLNNVGNIKTKIGNRDQLQQSVDKAREQESELSKAMQPVLEAITGFANAQAAATEAQTAAAQEEKAKKEAGQDGEATPAEGGEKKITTTSTVNINVTGGPLTDPQVVQLEQNLRKYSVDTINAAFQNAGLPAPNLGPPETTAVA